MTTKSPEILELKKTIRSVHQKCREDLAAFKVAFAKNPFEALNNSEELFTSVARLKVYLELQTTLLGGMEEEGLLSWIRDRLTSAAKTSPTTSRTKQLLNEAMIREWADLLEITLFKIPT